MTRGGTLGAMRTSCLDLGRREAPVIDHVHDKHTYNVDCASERRIVTEIVVTACSKTRRAQGLDGQEARLLARFNDVQYSDSIRARSDWLGRRATRETASAFASSRVPARGNASAGTT